VTRPAQPRCGCEVARERRSAQRGQVVQESLETAEAVDELWELWETLESYQATEPGLGLRNEDDPHDHVR
jgi:hypothetical protein